MSRLFAVHPLAFTWPYALVFWLVFLWTYWPEFALIQRARAGAARSDSPDAGSLRVILIGNQLGSIVAFWVSGIAPTAAPASWRLPMFWIGLAMLVSGSLLRRYCWRVLGEFFTGDVSTRADQPVIDRGPYRWVRHPSYSGGMLMFTGTGIALGNWLSVALLTGTIAIVYTYRVRIEERALAAALGEPYRRFMATRKRFIPFVF
ncbi:MAG TPA: isoprenylcysteine carboxylmethyltransferase family protein [Vicinamibacterales bacterium]|nr:isoprenylcysteine carboxylmethyltransferase family protein [Vicinamibacterales bacterium]